MQTGYIGTYYSDMSPGIFSFTLDEETGRLTEPDLVYEVRNPKYVSWNNGYLAIPSEDCGAAGAKLLELRDGKYISGDSILEEQAVPCYVELTEDRVYTANYHDGNARIYKRSGGRLELLKSLSVGAKAGCHQVIPFRHGKTQRIIVPCLELDMALVFDEDQGFEETERISFPEGSGPRHGVLSQDGSKLYLVTERSNELYLYSAKENGGFQQDRRISVLSDNMVSAGAASAAIRLSEDERFLYISVRGVNLITVFRLDGKEAVPIQHRFCEGDHPRDILIAPGGKQLLAVNRSGGGLVCFRRNPEDGKLTEVLDRAEIREGVSLAFQN